jgi:hypothetical protein
MSSPAAFIVGGIMAAVPPRQLRPGILATAVGVLLLAGTAVITGLTADPSVTGGEPAGVVAGSENEAAAGSESSAVDADADPTPSAPDAEGAADAASTSSGGPDVVAGVLPGAVPSRLGGRFVVAQGSEPAPGPGPARTVRVEVEAGLPIDAERFARFVMETLNDPRGWGADGSVSFARTDGEAEIRVLVASGATVDTLCAPLATNGRWSCGRYGHAALNADRWVSGAQRFLDAGGDLTEYRRYLVNHEVGHLLGVQHTGCPGAGQVAPIMVQQSLGLQGCRPNGWPHPN